MHLRSRALAGLPCQQALSDLTCAAQLACAAGIVTVILGAKQSSAIPALLGGSREVGTVLLPSVRVVRSHKRWVVALPLRGQLVLDAGGALLLYTLMPSILLQDHSQLSGRRGACGARRLIALRRWRHLSGNSRRHRLQCARRGAASSAPLGYCYHRRYRHRYHHRHHYWNRYCYQYWNHC